MRIVIFLAIALVGASANSQQFVSLALEPEILTSAPTLETAARANDFPTFDALYRANPDPAYRTLHELWTYAMTEPTGAFYGPETYARLSREYPRYAEFIAQHRIVDDQGNVFYPVSETRAFLLWSAEAAPPLSNSRVNIKAEAVPPQSTPKPAGSQRSGRLEGGAPRRAAQVAPAPAPVIAPEPVVIARPVIRATPAPPPTPVQKATNRGLFLVIIALVGIGLLALIVRTPSEVNP